MHPGCKPASALLETAVVKVSMVACGCECAHGFMLAVRRYRAVRAACRCQNDFMLLKSAAAIRRQLFAIEAGKCQKCKLDTEGLLRRIKSLPGSTAGRAERRRVIIKAAAEWGRNKETLKAAERLARHPVAGALRPCGVWCGAGRARRLMPHAAWPLRRREPGRRRKHGAPSLHLDHGHVRWWASPTTALAPTPHCPSTAHAPHSRQYAAAVSITGEPWVGSEHTGQQP